MYHFSFGIVRVAFIVVPVKSQYLPEVATVAILGVPVRSQYFPDVATAAKSQVLSVWC